MSALTVRTLRQMQQANPALLEEIGAGIAAMMPIDPDCIREAMRACGFTRRDAQRHLNWCGGRIRDGLIALARKESGWVLVLFEYGGPETLLVMLRRLPGGDRGREGPEAVRRERADAREPRRDRRTGRAVYDRLAERSPGEVAKMAELRAYLRLVGEDPAVTLAAGNFFRVAAGGPRGSTNVIGRAVRTAREQLEQLLGGRGV